MNYFQLKTLHKQQVQESHSDLPSVSYKLGNEIPRWKMLSHVEESNIIIIKDRVLKRMALDTGREQLSSSAPPCDLVAFSQLTAPCLT